MTKRNKIIYWIAVLLIVLTVVSWYFRPESRRLRSAF